MVSCKELRERIRAYQFALYDLGLFQDSHPHDRHARKLREIYRDRLRKLIDEYEQSYGCFVQTQADISDNWTEWVKDPWPWDTQKGAK